MTTVYNKRCGLFLGFHGCDSSVREALLLNPQNIRISTNMYDWLGTGFYVWENNYERALDWAKNSPKIVNPSVIGVVYELANCLDLMDTDCINAIKNSYRDFEMLIESSGLEMPDNKNVSRDAYHDKLLRNLDCAIINHTTQRTDRLYLSDVKAKGYSLIEPYDTVRGCFTEGGKLYKTEIYERTHIQVCIRNLNCIKGFFLPREAVVFPETQ